MTGSSDSAVERVAAMLLEMWGPTFGNIEFARTVVRAVLAAANEPDSPSEEDVARALGKLKAVGKNYIDIQDRSVWSKGFDAGVGAMRLIASVDEPDSGSEGEG